jgi:hypothetical protein
MFVSEQPLNKPWDLSNTLDRTSLLTTNSFMLPSSYTFPTNIGLPKSLEELFWSINNVARFIQVLGSTTDNLAYFVESIRHSLEYALMKITTTLHLLKNDEKCRHVSSVGKLLVLSCTISSLLLGIKLAAHRKRRNRHSLAISNLIISVGR